MPHESAAAAPKTKGFPGDPFHDPFHAVGHHPHSGGYLSPWPLAALTSSIGRRRLSLGYEESGAGFGRLALSPQVSLACVNA